MFDDEDFLLDDEDSDSGYIVTPADEDAEDEDNDENGSEVEEEAKPTRRKKATEDDYDNRITHDELVLSSAYDDIRAASKNPDKISVGGKMFDQNIIDAVRTVISCSPANTSTHYIDKIALEFFQTQGHNRIPSSVYTPDQPLRGSSIGEEFGGQDDNGFNEQYAKEAREQIARFIKYLADRDLSKDSTVSRKRKLRQLPAFIIFLFSSGMYVLLLNCETLPPEYKTQVNNAFKRIQKQKYDIVEALAKRYEELGRQAIADRVRKMGLTWFDKEPAELTGLKTFKDLELTHEDIMVYREFRPRYVNASKNITQELISDMIEVVLVPGKIYEKLKDKTRFDAISDVKQVYKDWSANNAVDSELASKIIWKDPKLVNKQ